MCLGLLLFLRCVFLGVDISVVFIVWFRIGVCCGGIVCRYWGCCCVVIGLVVVCG